MVNHSDSSVKSRGYQGKSLHSHFTIWIIIILDVILTDKIVRGALYSRPPCILKPKGILPGSKMDMFWHVDNIPDNIIILL